MSLIELETQCSSTASMHPSHIGVAHPLWEGVLQQTVVPLWPQCEAQKGCHGPVDLGLLRGPESPLTQPRARRSLTSFGPGPQVGGGPSRAAARWASASPFCVPATSGLRRQRKGHGEWAAPWPGMRTAWRNRQLSPKRGWGVQGGNCAHCAHSAHFKGRNWGILG